MIRAAVEGFVLGVAAGAVGLFVVLERAGMIR